MKQFSFILVLAALVGIAFNGPVESYKVDTAQSQIEWKGYKVTGSHEGTINIKNGQLQMENGMLTGGSFEIDMTSINCTDLSGGGKGKLEGHLKSDDFFGVKKYPSANFVITKVASRGTPGDYKVTGNLSIKETTKEIRFLTKVTESGNTITATADIEIDRTDYDVRYGSGSFFDNLGDKTIYDDFNLSVKLVTSK